MPCSNGLNLTPVPGFCNKYYICSSATNTLFIQSCPGTTLFSVQLRNCLPSYLVTCATTTTQKTTSSACSLINYTTVPGTSLIF